MPLLASFTEIILWFESLCTNNHSVHTNNTKIQGLIVMCTQYCTVLQAVAPILENRNALKTLKSEEIVAEMQLTEIQSEWKGKKQDQGLELRLGLELGLRDTFGNLNIKRGCYLKL